MKWFVSLVAALLLAPCTVTQRDWSQSAAAATPSAALDFDMVFDLPRGQCVLFGGRDNGGATYGDTWTWDGVSWTQQLPVASPSARSGMRLAMDLVRGVVVLFGGYDPSVGGLADTWTWDGVTWTLQSPATVPPARSGHAMWYDAVRRRVTMFGGIDGSAGRNDTWAWDGTDWAQVPTANAPSPRYSIHAAYDLVRDRAVLFGGAVVTPAGLQRSAETWEFDGADWLLRAPPTAPTPRWGIKLAYSFDLRRVVMFGGNTGGFVSETWEWDGLTWHPVSTATSPPGRDNHSIAYDLPRQRAVIYGGFPSAYDTWEYGDPNVARFSPYGYGCAGTAGTPTLTAAPGALPWIGGPFTVQVSGVPPSAPAFVFVGLASVAPVDLTPIGMPGCAVFVRLEAQLAPAAMPGVWQLPIPNLPALRGARLWFQAVSVDPGANPLGLTVTNAGEAVIG